MNLQEELLQIRPYHDFLVCIDSDGCVFDSMEIKQKQFFIPNAIEFFDLIKVKDILIETWEYVNLYSLHRGGNRFISLIKVFDLLSQRDEIIHSSVKLPDLNHLKQWIQNETKLSNTTLHQYLEIVWDKDSEMVLRWSEAVSADIKENLKPIAPFTNALNAIVKLSSFSDLIIVSQTPLEDLVREWEDNDMMKYLLAVAGQDHGTKDEQIFLAGKSKYENNKILMIGDAIGDLEAANKNGILFYPVIAGKENRSWEQLLNEGIEKFRSGNYSPSYQKEMVKIFYDALPLTPPWQRS